MSTDTAHSLRPLVVGVNHRTGDVALRDQLVAKADAADRLTERLRERPGVDEVVVLSTCNRSDITIASRDPNACAASVIEIWAEHCGVTPEALREASYSHEGADAVRHLLRVASSLDSMIVGESQISGQVRDAFFAARDRGSVGFYLDHLYRETIRVSKRVRTETAITDGAVSISYAAVELARKVLGTLDDKHVGIIGSGEMGELASRHMHKAGARQFTIFNRSQESADALAAKFGADVCLLDAIGERLHDCDVVISATDAPGIVLTAEHVRAALRKRNEKRMFLIDIAAPRDIDVEVGELLNTYLFSIDDLKQVVSDNADKRQDAALAAEALIDEEVETILAWMRGLSVRPVIRSLRQQYEAMALAEIAAVSRDVSDTEKERLEFLGRSLLNKFLHRPLTRLREIGEDGDGGSAAAYARELFGLEDDQQERPPPPASDAESGSGGSSG